MPKFVDDDAGYMAWMRANPKGFVLNCERRPRPEYLMLHRSLCAHITEDDSTMSNWTTKNYIKVCSTEVRDLKGWARAETGGAVTRCETCDPPSY